jgi:hypothetical protein
MTHHPPVIPTGAERSEAKWRDLLMLPDKEEVPPLRFASALIRSARVGMTDGVT